MEQSIKQPPENLAYNDASLWLSSELASAAKRAAALVDGNPDSATFGCADRSYWNYRTLTNFPGATWQQAMLGFAALHGAQHPNPDQIQDAELLRLAGAALRWWASIQHRDGSFDEWYLNERSYCPTAITGAGAALGLHLLGDALAQTDAEAAMGALERAGSWLAGRNNPDVMNQNVAAAAALHGLAELTGAKHWRRAAEAKLTRIRLAQSSEGWLPEYGGADFGYSTLSLDFLASCDALGDSGQAREIADGLIRFLDQVEGAGPAMPGRLGSRGTSHQFVYGALHFGREDVRAARLSLNWLDGLRSGFAPNLATVDDRYFAYFYFPQFALALREMAKGEPKSETDKPVAQADTTDLVKSGLLVRRAHGSSVTVSRRLGGAVAICRPEMLPRYHLGYEIVTEGGRRYSSAAWDAAASISELGAGDTLKTAATFRAVSSGVPLKYLMIPFQGVAHLLLHGRLSDAFQKAIKGRMISPDAQLPLRLARSICFTETGVEFEDELQPQSGLGKIASVQVASQISIHSPSARQDMGRAIAFRSETYEAIASRLNAGQPAALSWSCSFDGNVGAVTLSDPSSPA